MRMRCIAGDDPNGGNDRPRSCLIIEVVAELIYTRADRKSRIWFTAKIPADKGAARPFEYSDKFDGYIAYECPPFFLSVSFSSSLNVDATFTNFLEISVSREAIFYDRSNYIHSAAAAAAFILISRNWRERNSPVNLMRRVYGMHAELLKKAR